MPILNINSSACAFGDQQITSNPKRKFFDWQTNLNGVTVTNPKSEQFVCPPRQMLSLFSGNRSLIVDGTTAFSLTFMEDSRYRLEHTAGTDPSFAFDSSLGTWGPLNFTLTVTNQTLVITAGSGTPFANVQLGYTLYIKGTFDGFTSPFNVENQGAWKVMAKSNTEVTLARYSGTTFNGIAEGPIAASSNSFLCFFLTNVQVGDTLNIEDGFQLDARKSYEITQVTSKWVEFVNTEPLINETGILPGASGIAVYSSCKRFIRIECDQEAKLYMNGSSDVHQYLQPWAVGDPEQMAWIERVGPVWSASIYNRSLSPMTVNVFSVE